jgi:hypothetical protein
VDAAPIEIDAPMDRAALPDKLPEILVFGQQNGPSRIRASQNVIVQNAGSNLANRFQD